MNLNKVFIIGRLTADPQLRTTPNGQQVASFSVATNRVWTDKTGQRQDETEYHNIIVWGRQAEIASQFLSKGSLVMVEGRLKTRTWQNKDGQNIKTTEIISERIQLGPRTQGTMGGFSKTLESDQNIDQQIKEELPEINLETEEIKPEDLPF